METNLELSLEQAFLRQTWMKGHNKQREKHQSKQRGLEYSVRNEAGDSGRCEILKKIKYSMTKSLDRKNIQGL